MDENDIRQQAFASYHKLHVNAYTKGMKDYADAEGNIMVPFIIDDIDNLSLAAEKSIPFQNPANIIALADTIRSLKIPDETGRLNGILDTLKETIEPSGEFDESEGLYNIH